MVTTEIKNIRKKINALQVEGVGLLLGDWAQILEETIFEQTGLRIKKDNQPLDYVSLIQELSNLYKMQLEELTATAGETPVRQRSILEEIAERKEEQI